MGTMFACYIKDNIHYKIYGSYEELKEFDNLEHCPNYDDAFTMYVKEFNRFCKKSPASIGGEMNCKYNLTSYLVYDKILLKRG